ncbi:hypothetical protein F5Y18DRAFT_408557 [Xylariaceae sp. FL1019]|nr:hypothetical protein F5Y18DRAFT_408557 [Xylariaceae sp. FL1019]
MQYFHIISWVSMLGGVFGAPSAELKQFGMPNSKAVMQRDDVGIPLCHVQNFPSAPIKVLKEEAYSELYGNGTVEVIVSIGFCRQVWCNHGAAVWVCNDNDLGYFEGSIIRIADLMNTCIDPCHDADNDDMGQCQLFVSDSSNPSWNIIVKGDNNCFLGEVPRG